MTKEGKFLIYCLEQYKHAKGLSGKEIVSLWEEYRVFDYIVACYEALHTTGSAYTVEDIDLYIEARKSASGRA